MTTQLAPDGTQATTAELAPSTAPSTAPATGRGPLRRAWHRVRLATREMNDASRRVVELQAPWSVDEQWHSK